MRARTLKLLRYSTFAILGLSALWGSVQTAHSSDHVSARELQQAGKIMSLDEILKRVEVRQTGKIIEAELHRAGDGFVYEIEFLDDHGRVQKLRLDARTGKLLSRHRDD